MSYKRFWEEEIETLPRKKLEELQLQKLKLTVTNAFENNSFYRAQFIKAGVSPSDIRSLQDICKLPFTDKSTVRNAFPFGLMLKSSSGCVEMHSTSGTTGKPVPVFATRNDISRWSNLNARSLWMVGIRPGDILQNAYGYGLPTGGFGFHYGAIKLGAMVIPIGAGQVARQIETIVDFGVTALCMTPSFALYISEKAAEFGIDIKEEGKLKFGLFGAEPWSESTRKRIENELGISAFDEFGMTELLGPGMTCECQEKNGMHVWADSFFVECIDPETGEVLPEGKEGELVWTWLCSEGTAVIRYRSGDLASVWWENCPCGRTHPKIGRIKGRCDDAFNVNGFVVFPSQVEAALTDEEGTGSNFRIILETDSRGMDTMTVQVEISQRESGLKAEELERRLEERIKCVTGITACVKAVKPDVLPRETRGECKTASARVEDLRDRS